GEKEDVEELVGGLNTAPAELATLAELWPSVNGVWHEHDERDEDEDDVDAQEVELEGGVLPNSLAVDTRQHLP
ncbi:MAG: hypothetical protein ACK55Z_16040, partial [bacterium]